jgi:choline monooxygenase
VTLISTLPSRYYRDPAVWEIERREIFAKSWVMIALEHQLANVGDSVRQQFAGWNVYVERCEGGRLHAVREVDPLSSVTDPAVGRLGASCRAVIRAQTWHRFVFVCLDPDVPDLLTWLGAFAAEWAGLPSDRYRFHSRTVRRARMNWKVYNDNFLEGYHLPILHPDLSTNVQALEFRVESKGDPRWNIQTAPPRSEDVWSGVWAYFFPCFSFDVFPTGIAVERWLPIGIDRTDLIFEYFFADDADDVDAMVRACEDVADEDVRVCEMVQQNLVAGHYDTGWLSPKHEHALAEFHELVRAAVDPHLETRGT